MFEKDEDYRKARKESKDRITKVIKVWSAREETLHDECFQKGAEFGYNKANEWHYVKDGDLPKEYDTVLACTEFEHHKSPLICNYHYKKWWYADGKFDDDVVAWKEIVLPEIKESE